MALLRELRFTLYMTTHPFDGFWRMKSEKRVGIKTGAVLSLLFFISVIIRIYSTGYLLETIALSRFSIWLFLLAGLAVFFLYTIANWTLTTLLDGKGNFQEIALSVICALTPVSIVNLPLALLSNLLIIEEIPFYQFIYGAALIWSVFLLLAGNLSVHDYTMIKSIVTVLGTILFMVFIAVLAVLFLNLMQQIYVFISSIIREIAFRL